MNKAIAVPLTPLTMLKTLFRREPNPSPGPRNKGPAGQGNSESETR